MSSPPEAFTLFHIIIIIIVYQCTACLRGIPCIKKTLVLCPHLVLLRGGGRNWKMSFFVFLQINDWPRRVRRHDPTMRR